jgi:protein TonB
MEQTTLPLHGGWHKTPRANIRKDYGLTVEVGFVLAMLALIALFHTQIQVAEEFDTTAVEQEVVQMEEIVQTEQIAKPPPPPRPQIPVVVADDVVLEDDDITFDAALDIGEPLANLPPPPTSDQPEEEVEDFEDEIFVAVEQMPELIGGIESLQKEIRYPELARQAGLGGRVFVQFIVDEEGNITDPVVLRGIGGGCDEEALRVVKLAKFKPGRQRGRPVKVRYVIPIVFRLR